MTSRRNTIQKVLVRNTVYEMKRHVTANEVCPVCNHPQSYFEVHEENY